jgi:hypothetical protein
VEHYRVVEILREYPFGNRLVFLANQLLPFKQCIGIYESYIRSCVEMLGEAREMSRRMKVIVVEIGDVTAVGKANPCIASGGQAAVTIKSHIRDGQLRVKRRHQVGDALAGIINDYDVKSDSFLPAET